MASEAEEAAEKGELSTVYKITKQPGGNNRNHTVPVKDIREKLTAVFAPAQPKEPMIIPELPT